MIAVPPTCRLSLGVKGWIYMEFVYVVIGIVIVINAYMLFARRKKSRALQKKAKDSRTAAEKNYEDTRRNLRIEQEKAAKFVEMQNRTFKLYEQVRKRAEEEEVVD